MRGDVFNSENTAQPPTQAGMTLQNSYCIKYAVNGEVLAKQGAMVAYRGNLQIETKSQGVGNFLKRAVTGEGVALMSVKGQGEMWFANFKENVFVLELDPNDYLSINGRNVLVFDPSLQYQISMVKGAGMFGGGLFNCVFSGQGKLAITSDGAPIIIPVTPQLPVYVDTDAIIGWSSQLQTSIHRSQGLKSILKGGSGEMFQIVFQGQGFVIIQPSEGHMVPAAGGGGGGGLLGGLGG
ncbi:MAG: AIM24 family protein [Micromonosporaceae bacterium]